MNLRVWENGYEGHGSNSKGQPIKEKSYLNLESTAWKSKFRNAVWKSTNNLNLETECKLHLVKKTTFKLKKYKPK